MKVQVHPVYTASGINVTVSDMRRHLARVLSKLKGQDKVTFKFVMDRKI